MENDLKLLQNELAQIGIDNLESLNKEIITLSHEIEESLNPTPKRIRNL